jgi:hypothetical protein
MKKAFLLIVVPAHIEKLLRESGASKSEQAA